MTTLSYYYYYLATLFLKYLSTRSEIQIQQLHANKIIEDLLTICT